MYHHSLQLAQPNTTLNKQTTMEEIVESKGEPVQAYLTPASMPLEPEQRSITHRRDLPSRWTRYGTETKRS
jgi:hypothetical protein